MIRLSSAGAASISRAIHNYPLLWGLLVTPRPAARWRRNIEACGCWGMDNDRYSRGENWNPAAFCRALRRCQPWFEKCKFVVVPDVPFDAAATLEDFFVWENSIRERGYPLALAAQDGMTPEDIPWRFIDALFVGGSTAWKMSRSARRLVEYAKADGLWVHVGRVNGRKKALHLAAWGVDSIDGMNDAFEPDQASRFWTHVMRQTNAPQARLPGFWEQIA